MKEFLVNNYTYFQETIFALTLAFIGIVGYIVVLIIDKIFKVK